MKKIFCVILSAAFLLFIGCSKTDRSPANDSVVEIPFEPISEEKTRGFQNVMGYNGVFHEVSTFGQVIRSYYAENGMLIAETFGFPENSGDIIKDISGDGVTELIANVCYGGDGAERVMVWRLRDGIIEVGRVDYGDLDVINLSLKERYDPVSDLFRATFSTIERPTETVTWEWSDLSKFTFTAQNEALN